MATLWFYRHNDADNGPIPFRQLVLLVKDRTLSEDDLVRPEYQTKWQLAAETIGLFEMASRVPRERLQSDVCVDREVGKSILEDEASVDADRHLQQWFQEQLAVTEHNGVVGQGQGLGSDIEGQLVGTPAIGPTRTWRSVVAAAVARFDGPNGRSEDPKRRAWARLRMALVGLPWNLTLRFGFRCSIAAGVGWLAWSGFEGVYARELARFPTSGQMVNVIYVPILGQCSVKEYVFIAWDAIIFLVIVAYCVAGWIERHVEDV